MIDKSRGRLPSGDEDSFIIQLNVSFHQRGSLGSGGGVDIKSFYSGRAFIPVLFYSVRFPIHPAEKKEITEGTLFP